MTFVAWRRGLDHTPMISSLAVSSGVPAHQGVNWDGRPGVIMSTAMIRHRVPVDLRYTVMNTEDRRQTMAHDSTADDEVGVVVVEFELIDPTYPFVGLSEQEDCRVDLEKMLPRGSDSYAEFFRIDGADPDSVLQLAEQNNLVEPSLITSHENGGLFEFVVEGFCPARALCERGAIPKEVSSDAGQGKIIAEIPVDKDSSAIISRFLENHPEAELVAKRRSDRATPIWTREELQKAVDERLTQRQQEVLQTAFEAGYYGRTRSTTGERLAEELGISQATLSEHLRVAERKLISILLVE